MESRCKWGYDEVGRGERARRRVVVVRLGDASNQEGGVGAPVFADSREISNERAVRADVCVVGGGAAGIALAAELADSPLQVVVLEGGGLTPDPTDEGGYQIL